MEEQSIQKERGFRLPRKSTQRLLRAIREFDLIDPDDRVLVGFSGGKDSAFLLYALAILQKHRIIPFELGALTIDLGFSNLFDTRGMSDFCSRLGVGFDIVKTEIAKYAFGEDNPEGPCATCSYLRRGTMNRFARENGFNKIALAHHQDDAVETFLMSIIYSGQIKTFLPRTYLDRSDVTVIRPLVYFREADIREAVPLTGFEPVSSPCPLDGKTKRAETKDLIRELCRHDRMIFNHLTAAMREGRPRELWPAELSNEDIDRRKGKE